MTTERIQIRITSDGAKAARRDIEGLGAGADRAARGAMGLGKAIAAIVAGVAVKKVIGLADSYTDMSNRLRTVTKTSAEFADVQNELFRIAQRSRVPLDGITEGYSRMRISMQRLGLSQERSLSIQESLAQAIAIGGGGAQESASAMRQLGQAMGTGALKSDEFNSVMENAPIIMETIAKGMGKQVGDLKALAGEGKITSQVIVDAFEAARVELNDRFGAAVVTVSSAIGSNLTNVITKMVGKIDEATGATGGLAQGIVGLSDDIDKAIPQIVLLTKELTDLTNIKGPAGFIDELFGSDSVSRLEFWSLGLVGLKEGVAALSNVPSLGFTRAFDEAGARYAKFRDELAGAKGVKAGANHGLPFNMAEHHAPGPFRADTPVSTSTGASGKGSKGATFDSVMSDLRQEHEILKLSTKEQGIARDLAAAASQLKGKLHGQQLTEIANQLRMNAALVVANDLSEELGKNMSDSMNAALEARKAAGIQISEDLGRRVSEGRNDAFASGSGRDRGFEATRALMGEEQLRSMRTAGEELAAIFGPGGTLEQGFKGIVGSMTDIIGHSIAFGRSWDDTAKAVEGLGRSIVAEVISSLIRIPIQLAINETIASGLRAKATAETVTQAGVVSAAMAPAAAATSLATAGTNSAGATAAIIGVAAIAAGSLLVASQFKDGGYTGNGGVNDVAGIVHGREFVMNAQATARNRAQLEAMNAGRSTGGGGKMTVKIINQAGGVEFDARQIDASTVEIIARRAVMQHAADAVAADLRSPQSKTGRAMSETTTAQRRRA